MQPKPLTSFYWYLLFYFAYDIFGLRYGIGPHSLVLKQNAA